MGFTYNIKLPGFNNKTFRVKELNGALYRALIKSLYNDDDAAFIDCINDTIEQIVPGILQEDLNVIDKVLLLINTRSICVSPDLKLKVICPVTKKDFNYSQRLDELYEQLKFLDYTNTIEHNGIKITHSIIKVKHEHLFFKDLEYNKLLLYQLASSVDKIQIENNLLLFKELDIEQRVQVINQLPNQLVKKVSESIKLIESRLNKNKLLHIISPLSSKVAVDMPVSTNVHNLLQIIKFVFTDDLINLYKVSFNLVHYVHFSPEYIDSITPAEQLLYWAYFNNQQTKEQNNSLTSGNFPKDIPISKSEFM